MGVHGLWRLLDTFGEVTRPDAWKDKRVAIDASIWIAQFRASCPAGENPEEHILEGFFLRILKLLFYGIEPIFVFDGPSTSSKQAEHRRRAERRATLERSALSRCARQIVAAQIAAGVLDVQSLPLKQQSPRRRERKTPASPHVMPPPTGRVRATSTAEDPECTTDFIDDPPLMIRKRGRNGYPTPEVVSRSLTESFLSEAKAWIAQREKCEKFIESNALLYSSTSLFLGPRQVAEDVTRAVAGDTSKEAPSPVILSTSCSPDPSEVFEEPHNGVVYVDDSPSCEVVHNKSTSNSSVFVIDGTEGNFLSDVRAVNSVCRESVSSVCDVEVLSVCEKRDIVFTDSGDDTSASRSSGYSSTPDENYPHLWCPGTQLLEQLNSGNGVASLSDSHGFGASCAGDTEGNTLGAKIPHPPGELERNDNKRSLNLTENDASPPSLAAAAYQPGEAPIWMQPAYSEPPRVRQVVPFDLLNIVELLECCGIPFILSPSEADAQCAFLNQKNLVDAVFTEDSDVVVHGAPVVLRGFFSKGRHVVAYRQSDLLACGIDKVVLVALALLLGCDYAKGVRGLTLLEGLHVIASSWGRSRGPAVGGAAQVIEMLRCWRSAVKERCISWEEDTPLLQFYRNHCKWSDIQLDDDFPQSDAVDSYFNPSVDEDTRPFAPAAPNWAKLRSFAATHGILNRNICSQRLDMAQKEYEQRSVKSDGTAACRQRRLTDFCRPLNNQERVIFRKQPPKFSEALALLRLAKEGDAKSSLN